MNLLALDTSSVSCSVAIQCDGEIVERHEEQPREHTRLLLPMIESALEESRLQTSELDKIVLGNGPGSFIGMRIATSVAQGLAFASDLKIVPVSSMAAVAAQVFAENDADEVYIAQDAHMSEVYLGAYNQESGVPVDLMPERLHGIAPIPELQTDADSVRVAAGFGWQRYPELLDCNTDRLAMVVDVLHPRARYLFALADGAPAEQPRDVIPAYLRQEVAQKPAESS